MNRKTFLLCLIFCLILSQRTAAQPQHSRDWTAFKVSDDPVNEVCVPFFADSMTGYLAVVYKKTPDPNVYARWYRTINGGQTWEQIRFSGVSPYDTLFGRNYPIQFSTPSDRSIFLVGSRVDRYFYSLDRGVHWDTVSVGPSGSLNLDVEQYCTMFTEKYGIGRAANSTGPGLLKTVSGPRGFSIPFGDSMYTASMGNNRFQTAEIFYPAGDFSSAQNGCLIIADFNLQKGCGLTSIVTQDSGNTWKNYNTVFPGYENDTLYGGCQFQKGTSNVWQFPRRRLETHWGENLYNLRYHRDHPSYNISYCYSEDYGKTWSYDTSFYLRNNNTFGVSPGNVWMLLLDSNYHSQYPRSAAYTIAHTLDYGKTWDLDTVSLYIPDLGLADARCSYFTDKTHGWISAIYDRKPYVFRYHAPQTSTVANAPYANALSLFPNPARDVLHVEGSGTVQVLDALGRAYTVPNHDGTLDISALPAGVYYVSDERAERGKLHAKFVKE
jgi:hypothetical protein